MPSRPVSISHHSYSDTKARLSATQEYCDVLIMEWLRRDARGRVCSDCVLDGSRKQLSSPFGYNKNGVEVFKSITASCSKYNYPVTSPPPYTLSPTTTTSATSVPTYPPSCVTIYTSGSGNTCNSIAIARNVSSFAVYGANGIRNCSSIKTNTKLCLLGQCKRYQVQFGDTCQSILKASNLVVDPEIFTAWNPNINPDCGNIGKLVGEWICLRYMILKCLARRLGAKSS